VHSPRTGDLMVVFDVDDTLYLERDYVASGFSALEPVVHDKFGRSAFASAAWRQFTSGRRGNIFDLALADIGADFTARDVAELVQRYRNHKPRISLLPDARRALDTLRQLGVRVGVLTDGPAASQAAKVQALALHEAAEIVILTDLYGPGYSKPHSRGFIELARRSRCLSYVYVADNPEKDFVAPTELGWTTVRVRREGSLYGSTPAGPDVDAVISELGELLPVLKSRGVVGRDPLEPT
jgi:putative hydrolase of the HAD superfamily